MCGPEMLSIREVAQQTGVSAGTLRMWEARHGFPAPQRQPSGHRRYDRQTCEAIARVLAERDRGLSLAAAIELARAAPAEREPSLFAALRRARPGLASQVLPKRALTALSHAIEDECLARGERSLLFGAFQRPRFYGAVHHRWRELARTADLTIVFAGFDAPRTRGGICEIPLADDAPLRREWALICDGKHLTVALTAWEHTSEAPLADAARRFETIWTLEPDAVRHAARTAAELAAAAAPELIEPHAQRLEQRPPAAPPDLEHTMALMNRCIAYLAAA